FGSWVSGGTLPGTGRMSPAPIHPTTGLGEKLGGFVFCCASTGRAHAPTRLATMLPASARSLQVNIVVPPLAMSLRTPPGQDHSAPVWCRGRRRRGIIHRTQGK